MENELQSKLEELAEALAVNTKVKIEKETNPIYKTIQMFIILGIVSFLMFGLLIYFIYINNAKTNNLQIIYKEQIINKNIYPIDRMNLINVKIKGNKLCKYYRIISEQKSEFYTICKKIDRNVVKTKIKS